MTHRLLALTALAMFVSCSSPPPIVDGGAGGGGGTGGGSAGGAGGGDGAGGAGGGSTSVALADYCTAFDATLCALGVRCGLFDPAVCATYHSSGLGVDCSGQGRALVDAGTLLYDGAKAKQCLDQVAAGPCSQRGLAVFDACQQMFTGTRAVGQPCYASECVPNAWCDSSGAVCPSTCKPRVDAGSIPPSSAACPVGTFSVGNQTECVPLVPIGSDCSAAGSAFFGRLCVLGAYCDLKGDGGATCAPFLDAGAPCPNGLLGDTACSAYRQCVSHDGGAPTCQGSPGTGEPCRYAMLGPSVGCKIGLACSSPDGGVCGAPLGQGASCGYPSDCTAPLTCVGAGLTSGPWGTCQTPVGADGGCTQPSDCQSGYSCSNSHCAAQATPGQSCAPSVGCVAGYVCGTDGGCSRATCVAP